MLDLLTAYRLVTDNSQVTTGRSIRLDVEVAELRASRARLVLAADAERRRLERRFHDGVQQHLVALAVKLQLLQADPAGSSALVDELRNDVQQALDDASQLAQEIYPTLLDAGGLAVALRAVAASGGAPVSIEVDAGGRYPPEVACTAYFVCLAALERGATRIAVRQDDGVLALEVLTDDAAAFEPLGDRVDALGGRFAISAEAGGSVRVSCALPIAR